MALAFVAAEPPDPQVVPLGRNHRAPFEGLLVPEERFIELLEAERWSKELEARLDASEQTAAAIEQVYRGKLRDAVAVPWYDSPSFNRWLGIACGVALSGVAVWAAVELQAATR
jgi:hypothetical protein